MGSAKLRSEAGGVTAASAVAAAPTRKRKRAPTPGDCSPVQKQEPNGVNWAPSHSA